MTKKAATPEEISLAAIEYVESRTQAANLKAERARMLSAGDCDNAVVGAPPCYRISVRESDWCSRCRNSQPAHVAYRKAATRQSSAHAKLVRVVNSRQGE